MSENPLPISNLNDFIFCPVSIYFHSLEIEDNDILLKDSYQLNGTQAHIKSDSATYSTKKNMLQGVWVYSEKYDLCGKIDTFDIDEGVLTERKKKITTIYDGYVFQLYAQYFSLVEMGYTVNNIRLYSMDDNKVYEVEKPEQNINAFNEFLELLTSIKTFSFANFKQSNSLKCQKCIYEQLCSFSALKEVL